jgi:hypothetical protein
MLSTRLAVAGLSLAIVASPALAQSRGWFEFGAYAAHSFFDSDLPFDNELGLGGRVGIFLSPMFELEGEGHYMDLDVGGQEFRVNDDQANYTPLYLRGTAHFPISTNGMAFTAGAGITRSSYRYTYNWGPSAAVGVKIPIMSNAIIRVDGVADYLPTPKTTNLNLRAGLSFYNRTAGPQTIVERVTVVDEEALTRLRNDRARLDSIAAAYNRLRDSLATNPPAACNCQQPVPIEKDRVPTTSTPIKTEKDRRVP